jgi:hypothetical protein
MFIYMAAKTSRETWDAIIPHWLRVSHASRNYMIAMALKGYLQNLILPLTQKLSSNQKACRFRRRS